MSNVTDDDCGVYCILNVANNKRYVGSSTAIRKRWKKHIGNLKHGRHPNPHLQNAWEKYGPDVFVFYVVEICPPENRFVLETEYISRWDSANNSRGYNILSDATAGISFISPEARKRSADKRRGRPQHPNTIAGFKAYMSIPENMKAACDKRTAAIRDGGFKHITDEYRRKLSAALRKRVRTAEFRRKCWRSQMPLSDDDVSSVVRLKANGMSTPMIARLCGQSAHTVRKIASAKRHYSYVNDLMRAECDFILEQRLKWRGVESPRTIGDT